MRSRRERTLPGARQELSVTAGLAGALCRARGRHKDCSVQSPPRGACPPCETPLALPCSFHPGTYQADLALDASGLVCGLFSVTPPAAQRLCHPPSWGHRPLPVGSKRFRKRCSRLRGGRSSCTSVHGAGQAGAKGSNGTWRGAAGR